MATRKPAALKAPPVAGPSIAFKPISELALYAKNSRLHSPAQIDEIQESILEFGWTMPVLEDAHGVLVGHGRIAAATRLYAAGSSIRFPDGTEIPFGTVPVLSCDGWSEAKRRAYIVADNKLALNSSWDAGVLRGELGWLEEDGFNLALLGFGDDELADLFKTERVGNSRDPDALPVEVVTVETVNGDLWRCGPHRVLCGDSTAISAWQAVLGPSQAIDAVWTDPPYNVAYQSGAGTIQNDDLRDRAFRGFLRSLLSALFRVMKPGASIYVAHADTEGLNFRRAFTEAGFKLSGCLIWRKDSLVLGRSDFQWCHEPILYGWKPGAAHRWFGGRKETTIQDLGDASPFTKQADGRFAIRFGDEVLIVAADAVVDVEQGSVVRQAKPRRSSEHPTMKPVELIERQLRLSAKAGDLVGDACAGSGSTLMACERLGMHARVIELEPRFVDVIVKRWQNYTGLVATREGDGIAFPVAPVT